MARDVGIEARLQRWAQWLNVGDGSGFPAMSVLHPEWQPPSPGMTPTLKSCAHSDVRSTHRAVATLSVRLRNTLVMHYAMNLPRAEQALRLDCSESTVVARVEKAHRLLLAELCDKFETG